MRPKIRTAIVVVLLAAWMAISWILWPPKKWEDLNPEEKLRHDIDATAIW